MSIMTMTMTMTMTMMLIMITPMRIMILTKKSNLKSHEINIIHNTTNLVDCVQKIHQLNNFIENNFKCLPDISKDIIRYFYKFSNAHPIAIKEYEIASLRTIIDKNVHDFKIRLKQSEEWNGNQEKENIEKLKNLNVSGVGIHYNTEKIIEFGTKAIKSNTNRLILTQSATIIGISEYLCKTITDDTIGFQTASAQKLKTIIECNDEIVKIIAYKIFRLKGAISFVSTDNKCKEKCFSDLKNAEGPKRYLVSSIVRGFIDVSCLIDQATI